MDASLKIPGTKIRFGLDSIIGLIPGIGDLISFAISGYIMSTASKLGASKNVMARMMVNSTIDAIIGTIPLIGDIFDIGFKANQRNIRLMNKHFVEGKHKGGASGVMIPVVLVILILLAGFIWLSYKLITWIF